MNYQKIYQNLCQKRTLNLHPKGVYTEKHRILPGCMGGIYEPSNVVRLTPEEHLVAHELLVKIYPAHKGLIMAIGYMLPKVGGNKVYGWLRRKLAKRMSEINKGKKRSFTPIHRARLGDSNRRRRGNYSLATKAKLSAAATKNNTGKILSPENLAKFVEGGRKHNTGKKNPILTEWNKSFNATHNAIKNSKVRICPHCGLEGKGPNMTRYHFDKCRAKFTFTVSEVIIDKI